MVNLKDCGCRKKMKIILSWLKEYVEFDASPKELAERLTFAGQEVEGIETVGISLENVVVGQIIKVEKHPNADKLKLCEVFDGSKTWKVVCGAPEVSVGQIAPLALAGAKLANGLTVEKRKVRGELSEGMLCAEDELGISDDHTSLMKLPPTAKVGEPLVNILGAPEVVLTIEVTPNRPDCLSVIGLAREVAALYGTKLKLPEIVLEEEFPAEVNTLTSIEVLDEELCPRYTARIIKDVKVLPAPYWMQRRLKLCGVRPINNIVDITNYVMLECGQPLHAFDQNLLKDGRIVVRRAMQGEKIVTLDGLERELSEEHLVIADATTPVALAGIMGGEHSGILESTSTVLLESACFKPQQIRKTSKELGISSESSYRFERGVDIKIAEWASRRAASFMREFASGKIAKGVIDIYKKRYVERVVPCRFQYINDLLGTTIPNNQVLSILESLECKVIEANNTSFKIQPPSFRMDIEMEADIVEEVARIYGLDKIPAPLPSAKIVEFPQDDDAENKSTLRHWLCALGLNETLNYSFTSEKTLATFEDTKNSPNHIKLPNPISIEHSVLRNSLLPQLVETLGRNKARQIEEAAVFEMGRIFFKREDGKYYEEEHLALGIMGHIGRYLLEKRRAIKPLDQFLVLKGIIEELFRKLQLTQCLFKTGTDKNGIFPTLGFEQETIVEVYLEDELIGICGMLNETLQKEWRIQEPVALAEIKIQPLFKNIKMVPAYKPLPAFPFVKRDIAIKAKRSITNEMIISTIKKNAPKELTEVELFDIYEDERLGCDVKSMAYSLTYRSADRTLTDEEVNKLHQSVVAELENALGVEIRKS